jgi:hypothetical protein
MDFGKSVLGSVYYSGMFLAVLFIGGRRLLVVGGVTGAVFFPFLLESPHPFVIMVLLGAAMGALLAWLGSLAREGLSPYLSPYIDPDSWAPGTNRAAGAPPASSEERSIRLTLANAAAAGASSAGLLSIWLAEVLSQELRFKQLFEQLSGSLLTIVVIAWVGVSLFNVNSNNPGATPQGIWIKAGLLAFLLAISQEIIGNLMEKGLQLKDGVGIWILLVNSLMAGVVTYYWTAAAQLRQRSIARRATFSSSLLGGLMVFPPLAIVLLTVIPVSGSGGKGQEMLFFLLVMVLLAAVVSLFYGFLFFGLNALVGTVAIRFRGAFPVALRVLIGLLLVAALYVVILFGVRAWLRSRLGPGDASWLLQWQDGLQPFAEAVGWGAGLWLQPGFKRVMADYNRWKDSLEPGV